METSSKFVRENRYLVLRWDDITNACDDVHDFWLTAIIRAVTEYRKAEGKEPNPKFVCIKDTYPEYEMVWEAIEKRMTAGG